MASFTALDAKLAFRLDTGEVNNGKIIYRTISLGRIDPDKSVGNIAAAAEAIIELFEPLCDRVTFARQDVVEL